MAAAHLHVEPPSPTSTAARWSRSADDYAQDAAMLGMAAYGILNRVNGLTPRSLCMPETERREANTPEADQIPLILGIVFDQP